MDDEPKALPHTELTAYVEAYATSHYGDGPELAAFTVDTAFVERLAQLHDLCIAHHLDEVRVSDAPDWGPHGIEEDLRLEDHVLVVTGLGYFWYTARVDHADDHVETRLLKIPDFLDHVMAARAQGRNTVVCGQWSQDAEATVAAYREAKAAPAAGIGPAP